MLRRGLVQYPRVGSPPYLANCHGGAPPASARAYGSGVGGLESGSSPPDRWLFPPCGCVNTHPLFHPTLRSWKIQTSAKKKTSFSKMNILVYECMHIFCPKWRYTNGCAPVPHWLPVLKEVNWPIARHEALQCPKSRSFTEPTVVSISFQDRLSLSRVTFLGARRGGHVTILLSARERRLCA